jgi:hypothetical protein
MNVTVAPEEALLAVVGVDCVIKDEFPKIGITRVREAAKLMETIDEKVKSMVRGSGTYKMAERAHNYRDLLDRLTVPFPADEVGKIIESFPPEEHELAGPFSLLAQHAFAQVQALFPISSINGIAGPRNIEPTNEKIWHFFNQLSVLNNPLRVIDLIGAAALLKSQVAAMRDVYPTVSQYIDHAIIEAIVEAKAENEKFQLSPRAEMGVTKWRGGKTLPFKPAPPPEPRPDPKQQGKQMSKDLQTVGQAGSST